MEGENDMREYKVKEWKLLVVWDDGLVEEISQDLADDSAISLEVIPLLRDYEDLRNEDPEEYNASPW